ncbi:methyltransferase domain-containing protein [Lacisediminimonas profundi]|uniref:methyltransferase domain-containing protein n=1 Tax=Lacisediminimonas profundi TaxID=2603856 RepID=UPI001386A426|nr:methyltransferase domain-containing protein [Lacisediminimonas profundi]
MPEREIAVKMMDAQLEQDRGAHGLRERMAQRQRSRLFTAFHEFHKAGGGGSVLNVGARGLGRSESMVINLDPGEVVVSSALEIHPDASGRNRYARDDGRHLLYGDGEFDWVCCDGVLEHAGSFMQQFKLLKDMNRVARKGLFVTAANRGYPLDLETGLPLLHWLPAPLWHRLSGQQRGHGRHLLTSAALLRMASLLPGKRSSDVGHVRLGGPKAHFFLMIRKQG